MYTPKIQCFTQVLASYESLNIISWVLSLEKDWNPKGRKSPEGMVIP